MAAPRVRFAPSPTGYLHIGGARTALFNWLFARRYGGTFVLRIEDTDRERSTPESVKAILDGLTWLGIDWDEGPGKEGPYGPYFQTERLNTYKEISEKLIADGRAFRCYCTREQIDERRAVAEKEKRAYRYEGTCRELKDPPVDQPHVVRFKMPTGEGRVSFDDKVIGKITKEYYDLDDFVMLRADGIPLYNFGAVVDDHLMEITLVARGQEHINSTFPQLMIYDALGWKPPEFAHLPLILGTDREKLSKRKHPEADVMAHKRNGVVPEALLNFVVRLGWSHGNEETISVEQMKEWFDFDHVGSTSGVWNPEKLAWLNGWWLRNLPLEEVTHRAIPFFEAAGHEVKGDARLPRIVELMRERSDSLVDLVKRAAYCFPGELTFDEKASQKHLTPDSRKLLAQAKAELEKLPEWRHDGIDAALKTLAERAGVGMGKIAQPIRVAVTGNVVSPGIGETLEIIGRERSLERIGAQASA